MEETRKIYVNEYEQARILKALETLEIYEQHEEMVKNINYELPSGIYLKDLISGLRLIAEMSEVVDCDEE